MKFEDRSQEETERQGRCARGKLKEKDKATSYSPTEEWIMPAASTTKPEERKFVVDIREPVCISSARKTFALRVGDHDDIEEVRRR